MTFVAAAVPSTEPWRDHETQVLADAENVIVGVLFDDIVRVLLRPPAALVSEPVPVAFPRRGWTGRAPVTVGLQRSGAAWARSPPRE